MTRFKLAILISCCLSFAYTFPDPGKYELSINSSQEYNGIVKNVYNGTKIFIKIHCHAQALNDQMDKPHVNIGWVLRETNCWNEYFQLESQPDLFPTYYDKPYMMLDLPGYANHTNYVKRKDSLFQCDDVITLPGKLEFQIVEIR